MPSERDDKKGLRALGRAIRDLRKKGKLSGAELATRAEISNSWLSRIEDGQVNPNWGSVRRIAQGLGVDLEFLAEEAERFEKEG